MRILNRTELFNTALISAGTIMTINIIKILKATSAAVAMAAVLAGCAAPKQGPMFTSTSNAIRAAETAGALKHAPAHFVKAKDIYRRAEIMQQKRRTNRAQKLLDLASAEANLARAISEAAEAESSLGFIRTGQIR